jgi:hypothetical protein
MDVLDVLTDLLVVLAVLMDLLTVIMDLMVVLMDAQAVLMDVMDILNKCCTANKLPEVFTASCQYDFVAMETLSTYSKNHIAVFIIQK